MLDLLCQTTQPAPDVWLPRIELIISGLALLASIAGGILARYRWGYEAGRARRLSQTPPAT